MSRALLAQTLTADAFRPFGEVIEPDNASEIQLINAGSTTRFHDIAPVELGGGRALISIFRGKPFAPPLRVEMLERHPLGSQAFVPMQGRPFLVVVARDQGGRPGAPLAFLCDGTKGVSYAAGTWHHPLIALEETSDFLVVDRGGEGANYEEAFFDEPYSLEISAR